jgi:hypothetical protein
MRCRTIFLLIMLCTFSPLHYRRENVFFPWIHQQGVNIRVYRFPLPAGCEREGVYFHKSTVCTLGCIVSVDVPGVFLSSTSRVWTCGCIPFHHQQCGRNVVSISTVNVCVDVRVYLFSPPAGSKHEGVSFHNQQCEQEGVALFAANIVGLRVYSCLQSTVWAWGCFPFLHQQCGREVVSLSTVNSVDVR